MHLRGCGCDSGSVGASSQGKSWTGLTSTELASGWRQKQKDNPIWHQAGYMHKHDGTEDHTHDLEIVKEIINQENKWNQAMIKLEKRSTKITDRRVAVGHTHTHQHKGRFGPHIDYPVDNVLFDSIEGKAAYTQERD